MRGLMATLKHFSPVAAILGYIGMYYSSSKGVEQILPDLKNISINGIMQNYQNLLIAGAAGAGLYLIRHVKLPSAVKAIVIAGLWGVVGYEIALAIDPPLVYSTSGRVEYVAPRVYNPYALNGGGMR